MVCLQLQSADKTEKTKHLLFFFLSGKHYHLRKTHKTGIENTTGGIWASTAILTADWPVIFSNILLEEMATFVFLFIPRRTYSHLSVSALMK